MTHRIEIPVPAWGIHLSVGNPLIDAQHKDLMTLGREGVEFLSAHRADKEEFHRIMNDFVDLARVHFRTEEEALERNHFPGLEAHRREHEDIMDALIELLIQGLDEHLDRRKLAEILASWLVQHLLLTDLPCREYLKGT